jgi:hypothetical protein
MRVATSGRSALFLLVTAVTVALTLGTGAATAEARTSAKAAKPAKPAKAPTTLAALDTRMDAAVRAKGSVAFTHETLVAGTASNTGAGVVRWSKGATSFDLTTRSGAISLRTIVAPAGWFLRSDSGNGTGPEPWVRISANGNDLDSRLHAPEVQWTLQQVNPGRMFPKLGALRLSRGRAQIVDGVACSVWSVRMTAVQAFGAQPAGTRPSPSAQQGGTATVSFSVDARGLPHKVVEVLSWPSGSYTEVSTYRRWGAPVTVTAPDPRDVATPAAVR